MSIVVVVVFGTKKIPQTMMVLVFIPEQAHSSVTYALSIFSLQSCPLSLPLHLTLSLSFSLPLTHTYTHSFSPYHSLSFIISLPQKEIFPSFQIWWEKFILMGKFFFFPKELEQKCWSLRSVLDHSWKEKLFQIRWNFKISFFNV